MTAGELFQKLCGLDPSMNIVIQQSDQYLGSLIRTDADSVVIEDDEFVIMGY